MHFRLLWAAPVVASLAIACGDEPAGPLGPDAVPAPSRPAYDQAALEHPFADRTTPFQRSLMQSLAERRARGLPVPDSVAFAYEEKPAPAPGAMLRLNAPDAVGGTIIEATTTVRFADVTQAGLERWPALEVRGTVPAGATGFINEGDYTESVRRQILEQYPNANVDFDTGERTYTITETVGDRTPPQAPSLLGLTDRQIQRATSAGGMLLGFTIPGPGLDYHIDYDLDVCVFWWFGCVAEWDVVDFWAGFLLDWTIATRLPFAVSVTSPDPVEEGTTFTPVSAATGLDWSAADYTAAGVLPEDGNEFVLKFQFGLGVFLTVSYVDVVNWGIPPIDINKTATFATPLGPGQTFTLPSIDLSLWNLDVALAEADFGVRLTPLMGSDRLTADWTATGHGSGGGSVTYTSSGQNVALGAIQADDGPGDATLSLSNFRYHFTNFDLDLGIYFYLWVAGWSNTFTIPVTQFDLSALTGGLYLGSHSGTPSTLDLLVPVTNVAPSAAIVRAGTVNVHGQPVFLVPAGGTLTLTGDASDPGADDLTLTWDWGEGTPDVTTYPVPGSVRESRSHTFAGACVHQVTFTAGDDDGASGSDHVPVVVTGQASNLARLEGWWQHELGRQGTTVLDEGTLGCYLAVAAQMSTVLGEARDIGTLANAHLVLFLRRNGGDPREQFDRELLVVWLNYAHGAIGYTELVDTDDDLVPDTPFAAFVAAAEAARLAPLTTATQIRRYIRILHAISEAATT